MSGLGVEHKRNKALQHISESKDSLNMALSIVNSLGLLDRAREFGEVIDMMDDTELLLRRDVI